MLSFFMEVSLPSRFFFDDKDTSFPPAFQIKADRVLAMDEHQQPLTRYREEWLQAATGFLFDLMEQHGLLRVKVRVSCGWPSRGGLAQRRTVIGQCFAPQICADGCP